MIVWPQAVYVLIPAYKAAESLRIFLPKLLEVVPANKMFVVDDGSFDGTDELCATFRLLYVSHDKNKGKGAALATGFNVLLDKGAEAIITLDADGQHSVDDLERFIDAHEANPLAGIIIGRRKIMLRHMPVMRIVSNRTTSFILSIMTGASIPDSQCGYRLYSAMFLRSITISFPRFEMESEVIIKAVCLGFTVRFIDVQTLYLDGQSHISHLIDTLRWIRAVVKTRLSIKRKGTA
jgi:glycosyltransferase involved in cell wall biosynthesis